VKKKKIVSFWAGEAKIVIDILPDWVHEYRSFTGGVAQLVRAGVSYAPGRGFDSLRRHRYYMLEKRSSSKRLLLLVFVITLSFLVVEFVAAFITNSLALLADAGHMLADTTALGMALWASFIAGRQADDRKSYGYGRAEVLVAFMNAIFLFGIAGYTIYKAIGRIASPEEIAGRGMLIVAVAGFAANVLSGTVLLKGAKHNINVKAALFHVAGDALGSLGVLLAALIIISAGWLAADPIVSLCICVLIMVGAVRLFIESWHILMEGVPKGFDRQEAKRLLCSIDEVLSAHDIHAWAITSGKYSATAHLVIKDDSSPRKVRDKVSRLFKEKWKINHLTLQLEKQSESWICGERECCLASEPPENMKKTKKA
jgi:cobalt-zinc-cadmium efflux system protein